MKRISAPGPVKVSISNRDVVFVELHLVGTLTLSPVMLISSVLCLAHSEIAVIMWPEIETAVAPQLDFRGKFSVVRMEWNDWLWLWLARGGKASMRTSERPNERV